MSQRPSIWRRALGRLRGPGAWRTWLGLGLLVAFTAYACYRLLQYDLRAIDVGELLSRLSPADIARVCAVYVVALALAIAGWGLILGALAGCWAWLDHVRIYLITQVTRRLPGTYWYVLGRVVMYERLGVARGVTALSSGVELAATCLGGLVVLLLTWPLVLGARDLSPLWIAPVLAGLAALLNPPAVRWIVRKLSPHSPSVRYRDIMLWSLVYSLIWVLGGVILFLFAAPVEPRITPADLPAMIGIWVTAGMAAMTIFSFLPFGLGATELTIATLAAGLLAPAEALFVAFAMRAVMTACELACGVVGLLFGLPGLLRGRTDGTVDHGGGSLSDAEKPEGVFEARPVVPRKEAGFGGK